MKLTFPQRRPLPPSLLLLFTFLLLHSLIANCCSALSISSPPSPIRCSNTVPKVDRSEFDPQTHYYHTTTQTTHNNNNPNRRSVRFETPVLIENVLSPNQCESICGTIVEELADAPIDLQRKTTATATAKRKKNKNKTKNKNKKKAKKTTTRTDIIECELGEAFGYMMESRHDDSYFCFCEGILDDHGPDGDGDPKAAAALKGVRELLYRTKERLFGVTNDYGSSGGGRMGSDTHGGGGDDDDDDDSSTKNRDLFHFFPNQFKPSDCLVVAGEGATSTLHRDPYSWTGTSLCLEGTKVWRFIAPPGAAAAIQTSSSSTPTTSRRNEANTSTNPSTNIDDDDDDDDIDINDDSGVQTVDNALNSYRLPSVAWEDDVYLSSGWQSDLNLYAYRDETVPSAEELSILLEEENDIHVKVDCDYYDHVEKIASSLDMLAPCTNFPSHFGVDDDGDESGDNSKDGSDGVIPLTIYTVLQKPGDMLVIPAFWWHQTYALEPSLAIASQRCGWERDTKRVLCHIFDTIGFDYSKELLPIVIQEVMDDTFTGTQEEVSNALFEVLSSLKY